MAAVSIPNNQARLDANGIPFLSDQEARDQMRRYFGHITSGAEEKERVGIFSLSDKAFRSFARDKADEAITYALAKQSELAASGTLVGIYAQQGMSTIVPKQGKRWENPEITSIGALFLDVDYGTVGHTKTLPPTLNDALAIVNAFPLAPSMIVASGGGLYPYYLLSERVTGADFKPLNTRLIAAFSRIQVAQGYAKCDAVLDPTRVLRIPGTINGKDGQRRQAYIQFENLTANGSIRRYSVGDIETAIADVEAQYPESNIVQFPVSDEDKRDMDATETTEMDDEAIVKLICNERTDKGRKLYSGDETFIKEVFGNDWSSAEIALVNKLAFYTRNVEQIDRIWVNSPLAKRAGASPESQMKTLTRDASYRMPTISKALLLVTTHYTPKRRTENGMPVINPSDTGNADRFIELMKERARWGAEDKMWYVLDEQAVLWEKNSDMASAHIRTVVKDLKRDMSTLGKIASEAEDDATRERAEVQMKTLAKWITSCQSGSHPEVMLKQARSAMTLKRDMFDHDQMAMATFTKRLDLKHGTVRDRMPEDYFTRRLSVEFNAALMSDAALAQMAPTWHRFLLDIFNGDATMIDYVQRALGYSMTGDVREQKMFVLYGHGSNGKSTLVEVVKEVLGEYAHMVNSDVLTVRSYRGGASPDVAKLKGVRMAIAAESDEAAVFDEARVKSLTGGDTINARPLYGAPINFKPTHKFWLVTNHKPEVRGTDNGIWRRLVLLPMNVAFGQNLIAAKVMTKDPDMHDKLMAEAEGILAWLVAGCLKWQQRGLDVDVPEAIQRATQTWREDSDTIADFISDALVVDANGIIRVEDMNQLYAQWTERNMLDAKNERGKTKSLKARLEEKGFKQVALNHGRVRVYKGLRMPTVEEEDAIESETHAAFMEHAGSRRSDNMFQV